MPRPDRLPKALTADERQALLDQLTPRDGAPRDLVLLRLMLDTGLRAVEVVALRPEHVDLEAGRLVVPEGEDVSERTLRFSDEVGELLEAWMERRPESDFLFPAGDGKQLPTRDLRRTVRRLARQAGLEDAGRVTPRTLRHTFARGLYRDTKDLRLVQRVLGLLRHVDHGDLYPPRR